MLSGSLDGLEEYVQDLTVVRIDDAGHYPMRSHPGTVNPSDPGIRTAFELNIHRAANRWVRLTRCTRPGCWHRPTICSAE